MSKNLDKIEQFFSQIAEENKELKEQLIQSKFEVEEEKTKTQNMKETYFNINSFDESNQELDVSVYENIKYIKEENEKKLSEINQAYKYQLNSVNRDTASLKKKIRYEIENYDSKIPNNDLTDNILKVLDDYDNKLSSLVDDGYNKEKYALMINQKYQLATEENNFLKKRIMQEKIYITDQISDIQKRNLNVHLELIKQFQNELNDKKENFFKASFATPIEEIQTYLNELIESNKNLEEQNEKMKNICDELKFKMETIAKEKNSLIEQTKKTIVESQRNTTHDLVQKSTISKLQSEIEILRSQNESLLKTNTSLSEQVETTNSKIELQIKSANNSNNILLNQKNSMISQLNTQLSLCNGQLFDYKKQAQENVETIKKLNDEIRDLIEKNQLTQSDLTNCKAELNKFNATIRITNENTKAIEEINNNIDKKVTVLQKEKNELESQLKILNTKYLSITTEFNNMKNENSNLKSSINNYENKYNEMKFKFDQNEQFVQMTKKEMELAQSITSSLKQIYKGYFRQTNVDDPLMMLQEINQKLNQRYTKSSSIPYNESFSALEESKNSQLYENIILYILNLKSQNNIEVYNAIIETTTNNINNTSGNYTNINTVSNNPTSNNQQMTNNFNDLRRAIEELREELEQNYNSFEKRIRSSVNIDDFEKILLEVKGIYEQVIDYIIQTFYKYKSEVTNNTLLIIQIPLEKYNQILGNINTNMTKIEQSLKSKVIEYKGQSYKIENALNYLKKYVSVNS